LTAYLERMVEESATVTIPFLPAASTAETIASPESGEM
jgi:hypothetical protein